jgi:cytochrome P450
MASTLRRWAVQHVGPQLALRRAARQGQLAARLAVDRSLWGDPFDVYERMRARGPLNTGELIYSSASHAVVDEVLRSPAFGVGIAAAEQLSPLARRLMRSSVDPWAAGPIEPPSLLAIDPPDHTRLRRLVSKVFTARAVAELEPRIVVTAEELLDEMERRGAVDLVESYAAPLPIRVIAEILGVPAEMAPKVLEWGNAAATTLDPAITYRQHRRADRALRDIHRWLAGHLERLRRDPGEDLLSRLVVLVDDGETLTDLELRATALLLIGAGFETTVNLIGNGAVQLLDHPEQLALLRADPSLWSNAVEEVLRYDSPVQVTVRIAARDTEVCGHAVPAGRFVSLMLGGANRDPEVFDDPQRFDVTRANAGEHLAFSAGIHYCLGASLARLEGEVALRMLFERFPDLHLDGRPVRRQMRVLRGYEHLPMRLAHSASRTASPRGSGKAS